MANLVILTGRVGKVNEYNDTSFVSLAVSKNFKDKEGNWQNRTSWVSLAGNTKYIKILSLKSGDLIHVIGELYVYKGKDNQDKFNIQIQKIEILSRNTKKQQEEKKEEVKETTNNNLDDDLPF